MFYKFTKILEFHLKLNRLVVYQVLNKILQIDTQLTFNVSHILNHGHNSKKIFDGTEPRKKGLLIGGI